MELRLLGLSEAEVEERVEVARERSRVSGVSFLDALRGEVEKERSR